MELEAVVVAGAVVLVGVDDSGLSFGGAHMDRSNWAVFWSYRSLLDRQCRR